MQVVTNKIKDAMEHYPELNDIIEIAAHYEDTHPIHRICAFIATLTSDLLDVIPKVNDNGDGSE